MFAGARTPLQHHGGRILRIFKDFLPGFGPSIASCPRFTKLLCFTTLFSRCTIISLEFALFQS